MELQYFTTCALQPENEKLTFNGDGSAVAVSLTGEAAALCHEDTMEYAFTFGARGLCRYDVADRLVLSKDGQNYLFSVRKANGAVLELGKDGIELSLSRQGIGIASQIVYFPVRGCRPRSWQGV